MAAPVFPGDKASSAPPGMNGARARAGDSDAARLSNMIGAFCDAHDGDRVYERACAALKQAAAELSQVKSSPAQGESPGRMAAKRAYAA